MMSRPWVRSSLPVLLVAAWPFLYLLPLVMPGDPGVMVGNDFTLLYFKYKKHLLDTLMTEHRIPLWSPSEAAGYPFYANPFAAPFYPVNLLLLAWAHLARGYSSYMHTLFSIGGVSLFGVGLLFWLRALAIPSGAALLSALVSVSGLKLIELLRFPNAVHAAAWMPWMLLGATLALVTPRWRRGCLIAAGALVGLLTAGYLYYAYYQLFLFGPFVLLLLAPRSAAAVAGAPLPPTRQRLIRLAALGASMGGALLACGPYLLRVHRLLQQTTDRSGHSFEYATQHSWALRDTIGSLLFPPVSSAEGWYYLGSPFLFLIAAFGVFGVRRDRRERDFLILIGAFFVLITWVTLGRSSWLFHALWTFLPGFSSLRVWPRLNITLVPLLALAMARAFVRINALLKSEPPQRCAGRLWILLGIAGVVVGLQLWFFATGQEQPYWDYMKVPPAWPVGRLLGPGSLVFSKAWFVVMGGCTAVVLGALALRWVRGHAAGQKVLVGAFLSLTILDVGPLATRQWLIPATPYHRQREQRQTDAIASAASKTPRLWAYDTIQLGPAYSVGTVSNWYFARYVDFLRRQGATEHLAPDSAWLAQHDSLATLLGMHDGRRYFVSRANDHQGPRELLDDAGRTQAECAVSTELLRYDGDRLELAVSSACPVFVSFIDNWDAFWTAELDGHEVPVELSLGTFKAVRMPPGAHRLLFAYRPFG